MKTSFWNQLRIWIDSRLAGFASKEFLSLMILIFGTAAIASVAGESQVLAAICSFVTGIAFLARVDASFRPGTSFPKKPFVIQVSGPRSMAGASEEEKKRFFDSYKMN